MDFLIRLLIKQDWLEKRANFLEVFLFARPRTQKRRIERNSYIKSLTWFSKTPLTEKTQRPARYPGNGSSRWTGRRSLRSAISAIPQLQNGETNSVSGQRIQLTLLANWTYQFRNYICASSILRKCIYLLNRRST